LSINADDFGLSFGVNRGILEAYAAGGITSTPRLANGPAFEDAVASLHRLSPAPPPPGVGLHFNLTAGEPLAPPARIPSLCDRHTSGFVSLGRLVRRALTGRLDPSHVASECRAQLARIQGAGVTVTHIDSHRHVHAL